MKEYEQLRKDIITGDSQEELKEGFLRKGTALAYGARSKQEGDKSVRASQSGRKKFDRATREKELEKKVELIAAGLEDLSISLIYIRMMLGNMTGISVSSVLFNDNNNKVLTKLQKGLKIR